MACFYSPHRITTMLQLREVTMVPFQRRKTAGTYDGVTPPPTCTLFAETQDSRCLRSASAQALPARKLLGFCVLPAESTRCSVGRSSYLFVRSPLSSTQ